MADDRHRQDRPHQNQLEDKHQPTATRFPPGPSPPAPFDEPGRRSAEAARASMAATVTLPSIHEARGAAGYGPGPQGPPPPPGARPYPHDPRYASPSSVNGYPPPSAGQQPPSTTYLPPLQTGGQQGDPRSPVYASPDQRSAYYDDRRPPSQYGDPHQPPPQQQYAGGGGGDGFYYRNAPPGAVPPNGYPRPPPGAFSEYAQQPGGAPGMAQAAPRQRTSIACRYCRKRKVSATRRRATGTDGRAAQVARAGGHG